MFQLRMLGGLRLEGPGGAIAGRAAQRRRLALLARLALARGGSLTRDALCGLFWPESPETYARQSLSAALYDLRRVLGDEALPTAGEDLRLEPAALWCDAVAFEEAADAGRLEEAASLYAGPLLEGVYLNATDAGDGGGSAEEWGRWVEEERARLRRRCLSVLDRLADAREAARDLPGAIEALLRLLREDPYSGRTVLRLMSALERAGERAQAIQQGRAYVTRLRTELEAEPDAAVLALEERLRLEPPAPASGSQAAVPEAAPTGNGRAASGLQAAPGREPLPARGSRRSATSLLAEAVGPAPGRVHWFAPRPWLAGLAAVVLLAAVGGYLLLRRAHAADSAPMPPTIAVLPFEDLSGDRGNEYFVDGISDDLLTRLARVPRLRVISRISVQQYKGTRKSVRQIGRELGATHLLEGSVRRAGDTVRINAQLIDVRTDRHVWAERYDRELRRVFRVQGEIAERIAAALAAALTPEQKASLAAGGTSDPAAFERYVRGQVYDDHGQVDSAAPLLRRAIALDPGYAQPHAALALLYAHGTQTRLALRDSALAEARQALELDPRSTVARRALAMLYLGMARLTEAEKLLREALAIDPNDVEAMNLLSQALAGQRRFEEFAAVRIATLRLDPLNGQAFWLLGWMFEKSGDLDLAIRSERRAIELGNVGAYGTLAQFYMWRGDAVAAGAVANEVDSIWAPGNAISVGIRAELAARAGNWREAERLIQQPFQVSAEPELFPGYVARKLGRARADSLLAAYERKLQEWRAAGSPVLGGEARLAAVRGQRERAVAILRRMRAAGYSHCLPRPTLYYESLEGYSGYETLRAEMCAEAARGRLQAERSGARAQLVKLLDTPYASDRPRAAPRSFRPPAAPAPSH